ncbi:GntR family transcriptional regulator [Aureibacillus halotolerans]|uniref:GntR family transcriptional regulator n=1 Tax=Aureibacillus halotolerans TaxID=1508390 RepID=A0A4R6U844_9BACI|nr:GntR family transcriptional regulator [Aureibacillus halotolerans]TDQ41113.1 GntR family transcriptional regulator [Aureibacillus halotolerans]
MLNKNGYVPLYEQLRQQLRQQILNGTYKNGDMLPSENELMKIYSITRTTIRKAMSALVQEGLIQQIHGRGTFVSFKEVKKTIWNFQGFSTLAKERNETPVSRVLEHAVITKNGNEFLKLVRLRGMEKDGHITWMTLDESELPLALFPKLETNNFEQHSLYDILEKTYNCPPRHVNLDILPILSDDRTMDLFSLSTQQPLLKAQGEVFDDNGQCIETLSVVYGQQFTFKMAKTI